MMPSAPAAAANNDTTTEEERLLELAIKESMADVAAAASAAKGAVAVESAPVAVPAPSAPAGGAGAAPATATATATAGGAGAGAEELSAKFVCHLTHTDSAVMSPGCRVVKVWRMRNEGAVGWPEGTHLAFVGGTPMAANPGDVVYVPAAAPGTTVDIAVPLVAPATAGRHTSYWRLVAPYTVVGRSGGLKEKGKRFGHKVWADIIVEADRKSVV